MCVVLNRFNIRNESSIFLCIKRETRHYLIKLHMDPSHGRLPKENEHSHFLPNHFIKCQQVDS